MRLPALVMSVATWAALASGATPAHAAMPLIRDAEIENTIHDLAAPLLRAADLDADALKVHLVNDSRLNAFISSGMNLFLNTGLLMRAEDPSEVMGVMAHEFGHITGGHILLREQQLEATQRNIWLSYALGLAAALASDRGQAFGGVMFGTQSSLIENLMAFSRSEESQADQAGLEYLDDIGVSAAGLLKFMRILQNQELLVTARQDPYMRTHPLSRDRVVFIENHVKSSKITTDTLPPEWKDAYARLRAKLFGFLEPPTRTLERYPETDTGVAARYARAIAYYRQPDTPRAVAAVDELLRTEPVNPYLYEFKGQALFEAGDADAAIPPYREAVRLLPHAATLQYSLARALIARGGEADFCEAEKALEQALRDEPEAASYWRQLSIARANLHKEGPAAYAMAEYALRTGRNSEAKFHAGKAAQLLPADSPARLRAEDIRTESERRIELEKKEKYR